MRPRRSSSRDLQAPAPRFAQRAPFVLEPHEPHATLDDVRREVRGLSDDLGEKFLALTSMLSGLSKQIQKFDKRLKTLEKRRK